MRISGLGAGLVLALFGSGALAQGDTFDIYWIDADGGAATLIVTPQRQSVLMDAGFPRPDDSHAKRIVAAMEDAGIEGLDYFLASHFHGDHVGGAVALSKMVPIVEFIDHGDSVEQTTERGGPVWEMYLEAAETGKRTSVGPHSILPLRGAEFTFVASDMNKLLRPLDPQGPNPYCEGANPGEEDTGENARSLGYVLTIGEFQMLNLGDLTFDRQHLMACPENLIGSVDLLQVPHHGIDIAPQLMSALGATAAVSSTGARKGGSPEGYEAIAGIPGVEGIWQLHRALGTDDAHNTDAEMIANLTEENDLGYWIKAEVQADGSSYTITNARNGHSESYTSR